MNCLLSMQRIQYAKAKSDCIAKAEGTYDKKKKQEEKGETSFVLSQLYSISKVCVKFYTVCFEFPCSSSIFVGVPPLILLF